MNQSPNRLTKAWFHLLVLMACLILSLPSNAVPAGESGARSASESASQSTNDAATGSEEGKENKASAESTSSSQPLTTNEKDVSKIDKRRIDRDNRIKEVRARVLIPPGMQADDLIYTPFLFWRAWIHQELSASRIFVGLIFILTPFAFLFPKTLASSQEIYQVKWLKSFGIGIGSFTFALIAELGLARMGLFVPLAICILAFVQFLALAGLLVAAQSVGTSIMAFLYLSKRPANRVARTILTLWAGIFGISLLVLMPDVGILQELGNRMLALLAATGAGALIEHWYAVANRDQSP